MQRKRTILVTILLLIGSITTTLVLTWREVRQEQLNHALITAIDRNATGEVRDLLRAGADPNAPILPADTRPIWMRLRDMLQHTNDQHVDRDSALLKAAAWVPTQQHVIDNADTVMALVDAGADVNYWGGTFNYPRPVPGTPLLASAKFGKFETMKVLMAHHADVTIQDATSTNSLMLTARFGNSEIVEGLLERGADVDPQDAIGRTALFYALDRSPNKAAAMVRATVACLLRHGANANVQNDEGVTALAWAVLQGTDKEIIRLLLAHGANPNLPNKQGETALKAAQRVRRPGIVALLRETGAK